MSWLKMAALGAASVGLSKLTEPKAPKTKAFRGKPIAERMSEIDPAWQSDMAEKRILAGQMMKGEIPKQTREMIEMISAEKAHRGGFGQSERARNLTARDLGLQSLQLIQSGVQLSDQTTQFQAKMALSDANMAYESYASKVNAQNSAYNRQMASHANLWGGIFQVGSAAALQGDIFKSKDSLGSLFETAARSSDQMKPASLYDPDDFTPKG